MQCGKAAALSFAILLVFASPTEAESHYFRKGSCDIVLSGDAEQMRILGPIFQKNGFSRIDSIRDNRPGCLIGTGGLGDYEMYCFKNDSYQGGMFTFSKQETLSLIPAMLTVLMGAARGVSGEGEFIPIIPSLLCTQAICLPEKGCIPFMIVPQRCNG